MDEIATVLSPGLLMVSVFTDDANSAVLLNVRDEAMKIRGSGMSQ